MFRDRLWFRNQDHDKQNLPERLSELWEAKRIVGSKEDNQLNVTRDRKVTDSINKKELIRSNTEAKMKGNADQSRLPLARDRIHLTATK